MRRQAGFAAALVISLGVVLGATVFRTDIAGAGDAASVSSAAASPTNPGNWFHATRFGIDQGTGCTLVAEPPPGKALVVRQVRVDTYADPTPGPGHAVVIVVGSSCVTGVVGDVNPATVGQDIMTFDPGLGVPAGSHLLAFVTGALQAEIYTDGYLVPAKQVPATTVSIEGRADKPQQ